MPSLTVDRSHNSAYLTVTGGDVRRTVTSTENIMIDLDDDGRCVGVEFLNISRIPDEKEFSRLMGTHGIDGGLLDDSRQLMNVLWRLSTTR